MKCERCGEVNPAEIHTCTPQEPVAWMTNHDEPLLFPTKNEASQYCNEDEEPQPLYTAPPQREWQGLTDEEHIQIAIDCGCLSADWVFYGAAIERKLKEKNS